MLDAKSRWVVFQIFNFTPNSDQGNFPFKMKAILENMRERINSEDGLVKVYKNNIIIFIGNNCHSDTKFQ